MNVVYGLVLQSRDEDKGDYCSLVSRVHCPSCPSGTRRGDDSSVKIDVESLKYRVSLPFTFQGASWLCDLLLFTGSRQRVFRRIEGNKDLLDVP